jgi:predicted dehydrogenase
MQTINWAVLGCGHIAKTFMSGANNVSHAHVMACASSDADRAKAFAEQFGIAQHFGSYQEMLQERSIHAVYVATTHNFHFENILMCLRNGKHVLCEKPLTLNAEQANQCYKLAKQNKLLLIEAVWTRFLPAISALKEVLNANTIGEVQCVQANFSINRELPETHRLNNPILAGGALLDLGIYPITIADIVFGKTPVNIESQHIKARTGVDKNSFYTLQYECGAVAQLSAGFGMSGLCFANIMGDKGHISIPFFLGAKSFTVTLEGQEPQQHSFEFDEADNFKFEIEHVTQILQEALQGNQNKSITSNIMPEETTIRMMRIMDTIRKQWGLSYADERK